MGSLKLPAHRPRRRDGAGSRACSTARSTSSPPGSTRRPGRRQFETLPGDHGCVVGAQIGAFTGKRDTHVNLFFRYATRPRRVRRFHDARPARAGQDHDRRARAHRRARRQLRDRAFGLMLGGVPPLVPRRERRASTSTTSTRASSSLRPARLLRRAGRPRARGLVPGAAARRADPDRRRRRAPRQQRPAHAERCWRFGVIPFLSPAGPRRLLAPPVPAHLRASPRGTHGAKALYPRTTCSRIRDVEHFLGVRRRVVVQLDELRRLRKAPDASS